MVKHEFYNNPRFHHVQHPLVEHKLALLRDSKTTTKQFMELAEEIAMLITYEATKDLPLEDVKVDSPLEIADCKMVSGRAVGIVPILRAGLGMVNGIHTLFPSAKVGHIGLCRNEETLEPFEYYCKLPTNIDKKVVMVVDPMLATGGSACDAILKLKERGCKNIRFMAILGAPEGVSKVAEEHPDVPIFVSTLDRCLNENGYILPGLGDAGDRLFGTK